MSDVRLLAVVFGGIAVFSGYAALWGIRRRAAHPGGRQRLPFLFVAGVVILSGLVAGGSGAALYAFPLVADRTSHSREVAPGVQYSSFHRALPRPHYVHILSVDLDTPGLSFVLTERKGSGRRPFLAQTTSDFLRSCDCVAAINASFFQPFYSHNPLHYYPKDGDPVATVGRYGHADEADLGPRWGVAVYLKGRAVRFGGPPLPGGDIVEARRYLIRHGIRVSVPETQPTSRTVLALSGRELLWLVVDGRVPDLAEGLTYRELTQLLLSLGVEEAVELDGGGSSTMVLRGAAGIPEVVNLPAHTRIPYRERPVATHLGLRWSEPASQ